MPEPTVDPGDDRHPHGVEIARHLIEIEERFGFSCVVVAAEGLEQAKRYSSQLDTLREQLEAVTAQLDAVLAAMVVSGGKEGT